MKLYRFQPYAQIKLEPWLVQRALDRLGDRRLKFHGAGNRRGRDADAYEGPMAGLVGNIALAEASPRARLPSLVSLAKSEAVPPSGERVTNPFSDKPVGKWGHIVAIDPLR